MNGNSDKRRSAFDRITRIRRRLREAPSAIVAMLRFAEGSASWEDVLLRLAVFLTAAVRNAKPPPLARMIATGSVSRGLAQRLDSIRLAHRTVLAAAAT